MQGAEAPNLLFIHLFKFELHCLLGIPNKNRHNFGARSQGHSARSCSHALSFKGPRRLQHMLHCHWEAYIWNINDNNTAAEPCESKNVQLLVAMPSDWISRSLDAERHSTPENEGLQAPPDSAFPSCILPHCFNQHGMVPTHIHFEHLGPDCFEKCICCQEHLVVPASAILCWSVRLWACCAVKGLVLLKRGEKVVAVFCQQILWSSLELRLNVVAQGYKDCVLEIFSLKHLKATTGANRFRVFQTTFQTCPTSPPKTLPIQTRCLSSNTINVNNLYKDNKNNIMDTFCTLIIARLPAS